MKEHLQQLVNLFVPACKEFRSAISIKTTQVKAMHGVLGSARCNNIVLDHQVHLASNSKPTDTTKGSSIDHGLHVLNNIYFIYESESITIPMNQERINCFHVQWLRRRDQFDVANILQKKTYYTGYFIYGS